MKTIGKWQLLGEFPVCGYGCPKCCKIADWPSPYCPNCGENMKVEKENDCVND